MTIGYIKGVKVKLQPETERQHLHNKIAQDQESMKRYKEEILRYWEAIKRCKKRIKKAQKILKVKFADYDPFTQ